MRAAHCTAGRRRHGDAIWASRALPATSRAVGLVLFALLGLILAATPAFAAATVSTEAGVDFLEEEEVRSGGFVLRLDVAGDTLVASVDGSAIVAALTGGTAWTTHIVPGLLPGSVIRLSDTRLAITLPGAADYTLGEPEDVSIALPSTVLTSGVASEPAVVSVVPSRAALVATIDTVFIAQADALPTIDVFVVNSCADAANRCPVADDDVAITATGGDSDVVESGAVAVQFDSIALSCPDVGCYTLTFAADGLTSATVNVDVLSQPSITAISGSSFTESDVVLSGGSFAITIAGDTFIDPCPVPELVAAGIATALGCDDATEPNGWDCTITPTLSVSVTSPTVVTVSFAATAVYATTINENIQVVLPGEALTNGCPIVDTTGGISVTDVAAVASLAVAGFDDERTMAGATIDITLTAGIWAETVGSSAALGDAGDAALIAAVTGSDDWDASVTPVLLAALSDEDPNAYVLERVDVRTVRITVPQLAADQHVIAGGDETVSVSVPAAALAGAGAVAIAAVGTFTIGDYAGDVSFSMTPASGLAESTLRDSGALITIELAHDRFASPTLFSAAGVNGAADTALLDGIASSEIGRDGAWDAAVRPAIDAGGYPFTRVDVRTVTIQVPPVAAYALASSETLSFTLATVLLEADPPQVIAADEQVVIVDEEPIVTLDITEVSEADLVDGNVAITLSVERAIFAADTVLSGVTFASTLGVWEAYIGTGPFSGLATTESAQSIAFALEAQPAYGIADEDDTITLTLAAARLQNYAGDDIQLQFAVTDSPTTVVLAVSPASVTDTDVSNDGGVSFTFTVQYARWHADLGTSEGAAAPADVALINSISSPNDFARGWDAEVTPVLLAGLAPESAYPVSRDQDDTVTLVLPTAVFDYEITADETLDILLGGAVFAGSAPSDVTPDVSSLTVTNTWEYALTVSPAAVNVLRAEDTLVPTLTVSLLNKFGEAVVDNPVEYTIQVAETDFGSALSGTTLSVSGTNTFVFDNVILDGIVDTGEYTLRFVAVDADETPTAVSATVTVDANPGHRLLVAVGEEPYTAVDSTHLPDISLFVANVFDEPVDEELSRTVTASVGEESVATLGGPTSVTDTADFVFSGLTLGCLDAGEVIEITFSVDDLLGVSTSVTIDAQPTLKLSAVGTVSQTAVRDGTGVVLLATLTLDTWQTDVGEPESAPATALLNAIVAAGESHEPGGWNSVVTPALLAERPISLDSPFVARIQLPGVPSYLITEDETISLTVGSSITQGTCTLESLTTVTVSNDPGAISVVTTLVNEANISEGPPSADDRFQISVTLEFARWHDDLGAHPGAGDPVDVAFLDGIVSQSSEDLGWANVVYPAILASINDISTYPLVREGQTVTLSLPPTAVTGYAITTDEVFDVSISAAVQEGSNLVTIDAPLAFTIADLPVQLTLSGSLADNGVDELDISEGTGASLTMGLAYGSWLPESSGLAVSPGADLALDRTLLASIASAGAPAPRDWTTQVGPALEALLASGTYPLERLSDFAIRVTLPISVDTYDIDGIETVAVSPPATLLGGVAAAVTDEAQGSFAVIGRLGPYLAETDTVALSYVEAPTIALDTVTVNVRDRYGDAESSPAPWTVSAETAPSDLGLASDEAGIFGTTVVDDLSPIVFDDLRLECMEPGTYEVALTAEDLRPTSFSVEVTEAPVIALQAAADTVFSYHREVPTMDIFAVNLNARSTDCQADVSVTATSTEAPELEGTLAVSGPGVVQFDDLFLGCVAIGCYKIEFDSAAFTDGATSVNVEVVELPSIDSEAVGAENESDIVAGGGSFTIALIGNKFKPSVGDQDDASTIALLDGFVSTTGESSGWPAIRAELDESFVTRVNDTHIIIDLPPVPDFAITAEEKVDLTIPAAALMRECDIVGAAVIAIADAPASVTVSMTFATEADLVSSTNAPTMTFVIENARWADELGTFVAGKKPNAADAALVEAVVSSQNELYGWNNVVKPLLVAALGVDDELYPVERVSDRVATITLPIVPSYAITANESLVLAVSGSTQAGLSPETAETTSGEIVVADTPAEIHVSGSLTQSVTEENVSVDGGLALDIELRYAAFHPDVGTTGGASPLDRVLVESLVSDSDEEFGWNAVVVSDLISLLGPGGDDSSVVRTDVQTIRVILPVVADYIITQSETVSVNLPKFVQVGSDVADMSAADVAVIANTDGVATLEGALVELEAQSTEHDWWTDGGDGEQLAVRLTLQFDAFDHDVAVQSAPAWSALLGGLAAATNEPFGWNGVISPLLQTGTQASVTRTSERIVDIVFAGAVANYFLTADETISWSVDATALLGPGANSYDADGSFDIRDLAGEASVGGYLGGETVTERDVTESGVSVALTLVYAGWHDDVISDNALKTLVAGMLTGQTDGQYAWTATVIPALTAQLTSSDDSIALSADNRVLSFTVDAVAGYAIANNGAPEQLDLLVPIQVQLGTAPEEVAIGSDFPSIADLVGTLTLAGSLAGNVQESDVVDGALELTLVLAQAAFHDDVGTSPGLSAAADLALINSITSPGPTDQYGWINTIRPALIAALAVSQDYPLVAVDQYTVRIVLDGDLTADYVLTADETIDASLAAAAQAGLSPQAFAAEDTLVVLDTTPELSVASSVASPTEANVHDDADTIVFSFTLTYGIWHEDVGASQGSGTASDTGLVSAANLASTGTETTGWEAIVTPILVAACSSGDPADYPIAADGTKVRTVSVPASGIATYVITVDETLSFVAPAASLTGIDATIDVVAPETVTIGNLHAIVSVSGADDLDETSMRTAPSELEFVLQYGTWHPDIGLSPNSGNEFDTHFLNALEGNAAIPFGWTNNIRPILINRLGFGEYPVIRYDDATVIVSLPGDEPSYILTVDDVVDISFPADVFVGQAPLPVVGTPPSFTIADVAAELSVTGTIFSASPSEADFASQGVSFTIVYELLNAPWHPDLGVFGPDHAAVERDLLDGMLSTPNEEYGWTQWLVPALKGRITSESSPVARLSDTLMRITVQGAERYSLTEDETVSIEVPASAQGGIAPLGFVSGASFVVTDDPLEVAVSGMPVGADESDVQGGLAATALTFVISNAQWNNDVATSIGAAADRAFILGLVSNLDAGSETYSWTNVVTPKLLSLLGTEGDPISRPSFDTVVLTLSGDYFTYTIPVDEVISIVIGKAALSGTGTAALIETGETFTIGNLDAELQVTLGEESDSFAEASIGSVELTFTLTHASWDTDVATFESVSWTSFLSGAISAAESEANGWNAVGFSALADADNVLSLVDTRTLVLTMPEAGIANFAISADETWSFAATKTSMDGSEPSAVASLDTVTVSDTAGEATLGGTFVPTGSESFINVVGSATVEISLTYIAFASGVGSSPGAAAAADVALVNGLVAEEEENFGWNAAVVPVLVDALGGEVDEYPLERVSDQLVRITVPLITAYALSGDETINAIVPPQAVAGSLTDSYTATPSAVVVNTDALVTVTGSLIDDGATEAELVAGTAGTLIIDLFSAEFDPTIGNAEALDHSAAVALFGGLVSDKDSEPNGWGSSDVVDDFAAALQNPATYPITRTGQTVTITLPPLPSYATTVAETISITVAADAVVGEEAALPSSESFTVTNVDAVVTAAWSGPDESDMAATGATLALTLQYSTWKAEVGTSPGANAVADQEFINMISGQADELNNWSAYVQGALFDLLESEAYPLARDGQTVTLTIPAMPDYVITVNDELTVIVPNTIQAGELPFAVFLAGGVTIANLATEMSVVITPDPLLERHLSLDGGAEVLISFAYGALDETVGASPNVGSSLDQQFIVALTSDVVSETTAWNAYLRPALLNQLFAGPPPNWDGCSYVTDETTDTAYYPLCRVDRNTVKLWFPPPDVAYKTSDNETITVAMPSELFGGLDPTPPGEQTFVIVSQPAPIIYESFANLHYTVPTITLYGEGFHPVPEQNSVFMTTDYGPPPIDIVVVSGDETHLVVDLSMHFNSEGAFLRAFLTAFGDISTPVVIAKVLGDPPVIVAYTADDLDDSDFEYSDGDAVTISFGEAMFDTGAATKTDIDAMFAFDSVPGSEYTGEWVSDRDFQITILAIDAEAGPVLDVDTVTCIGAGIVNAANATQSCPNTSPALIGDWGNPGPPGPYAFLFVIDDPDNDDNDYGYGDRLTLTFDQSTNRPPVATKAEIDHLMSFSEPIAKDYTGAWTSSRVLEIRILDTEGFEAPVANAGELSLTATMLSRGRLRDTDENSAYSTSTSVSLQGGTGERLGPQVTSIVASDPDQSSQLYEDGDIVTVLFDQDTNMPRVDEMGRLNLVIANAFIFGADTTGVWISPSELRLTVVDSTGGFPIIGQLQLTLTSALRSADLKSFTSSGSSGVVLSGSFGSTNAPAFTAFTGYDLEGANPGFGRGDAVVLSLNMFVEQVPVATKAQIDDVFVFSEPIGVDYTGEWIDGSNVLISVVEPGPYTMAAGSTQVMMNPKAGLTHVSVETQIGMSLSGVLTGGFGAPVYVTGAFPTAGPAGSKVNVTLNRAINIFNSGNSYECIIDDVVYTGRASSFQTIECEIPPQGEAAVIGVAVREVDVNGDVVSYCGSATYAYGAQVALTSLSPRSGPTSGGTSIRAIGAGFVPGKTQCVFSASTFVNARYISPSVVECTSPALGITENVRFGVVVNDVLAYSDPVPGFYFHDLEVETISPSRGMRRGGVLVTVTGGPFLGGSSVACKFGETRSAQAYYGSVDTLYCLSPSADEAEAVPVSVSMNGQNFQTGADPMLFTYSDNAFVDSISPVAHAADGGTLITIRGGNFPQTAKCGFRALTISTEPESVSSTRIVCPVPEMSFYVNPNVEVILNEKEMTRDNVAMTYLGSPGFSIATVTSVVPAAGPTSGGYDVVVRGANYYPTTFLTCKLGDLEIQARYLSYSTMSCTIPEVEDPGVIRVLASSDGHSFPSLDDASVPVVNFTYIANPKPITLSPLLAASTGGTVLTLGLTNAVDDAAVDTMLCRFGGVVATRASVVEGSASLRASCPVPARSGNLQLGNITVELSLNNGQQYSSSVLYLQYHERVIVGSLSPPRGSVDGNTVVTVNGLNFFDSKLARPQCRFGDLTVKATIVSDTRLTCVSPVFQIPDSATSTGGNGNSAGGSGGSTVDSGGSSSNDTAVAEGEDDAAVELEEGEVHIGYNAFDRFPVALEVSMNGQDISDMRQMYVFLPNPSLERVEPVLGPAHGGTEVLVVGERFFNNDLISCRFASASVKATFMSVTTVKCVTPQNPSGARTDTAAAVSISNNNDEFFGAVDFDFRVAYEMSALVPDIGPQYGGNAVTVVGANFATGDRYATCLINGIVRAPATVLSSTELTCVMPTLPIGQVEVAISMNGADYATRRINYTSIAIPEIFEAFPSSMPVGETTEVEIGGFQLDSDVRFCVFGAIRVPVRVQSSRLLFCDAPRSNVPGVVPLILETGLGFPTANSFNFTYYPGVSVTSVTPNFGPQLADVDVTVFGENFWDSGSDMRCLLDQAQFEAEYLAPNALLCHLGPGAGNVSVEVSMNGVHKTSDGKAFYQFLTGIRSATDLKVADMVPNSGPSTGGTVVTMVGTAFTADTAETSFCRLGFTGTPFPAIWVEDTVVHCVIPSENEAFGRLESDVPLARRKVIDRSRQVTASLPLQVSPNGQNWLESPALFSYYIPAEIDGFSPSSGPESGYFDMRLIGRNFRNTSGVLLKVRIEDVPDPQPAVFESSTSIRVWMPPLPSGEVSIELAMNNQDYQVAPKFTYTVCKDGWFAPSFDQVCQPCPPGTGSRDARRCPMCESGTYQGAIGASECDRCPPLTNSAPNSTMKEECSCAVGAFHPEGKIGVPCNACPEGGVCPGGTAPPRVAPGYWGHPDKPYIFLACDPFDSCPGGELETCAPGYEGRLCAQCSFPTHYKSGVLCELCPTSPEWRMIMFVAGCLLLIVVAFLMAAAAAKQSTKRGSSERGKWMKRMFAPVIIAVNFVQLVAIMSEFPIPWPTTVIRIFNGMSIANFNLDLLASECSAPVTYADKWVISMTLPLIFASVFGLVYAVRYLQYRILTKRASKVAVTAIRRLPKNATALQKLRRRYELAVKIAPSPASIRKFRRIVLGGIIALMSFSYLFLAKSSVELFDCTIQDDGARSLDAQPSLVCYDSWWWNYFPLGLFFALLYALLIPVIFLGIFMLRQRLNPVMFRQVFGSLFTRYHDGAAYWELLIIGRKIGLVMARMFFSNFPMFQPAIALVVLCFSLQFQSLKQPYKIDAHNLLEITLLWVAFLIMVVGVLFVIGDFPNDNFLPVLTNAVIALIATAATAIVVAIVYQAVVVLKMEDDEDDFSDADSEEVIDDFNEDVIRARMIIDRILKDPRGYPELQGLTVSERREMSEGELAAMIARSKKGRGLRVPLAVLMGLAPLPAKRRGNKEYRDMGIDGELPVVPGAASAQDALMNARAKVESFLDGIEMDDDEDGGVLVEQFVARSQKGGFAMPDADDTGMLLRDGPPPAVVPEHETAERDHEILDLVAGMSPRARGVRPSGLDVLSDREAGGMDADAHRDGSIFAHILAERKRAQFQNPAWIASKKGGRIRPPKDHKPVAAAPAAPTGDTVADGFALDVQPLDAPKKDRPDLVPMHLGSLSNKRTANTSTATPTVVPPPPMLKPKKKDSGPKPLPSDALAPLPSLSSPARRVADIPAVDTSDGDLGDLLSKRGRRGQRAGLRGGQTEANEQRDGAAAASGASSAPTRNTDTPQL